MKKFNVLLLTIVLLFIVLEVNTKAGIADWPVLTHEGSEVPYVKERYYGNPFRDIKFKYLYGELLGAYNESAVYIINYEYGEATSIPGTMTNLYNCHAFALHFKGVAPKDEEAICISHPSIYFTDGSLIEIPISEVSDGDIIAYYMEGSSMVDPKHTGVIIDSTTKTLEGLIVKSKDGEGLLLEHNPRACEYYRGNDNYIKFYRWNHTYSEAHFSNDTNHYYSCVKCSIEINEKHNKSYTKLEDAFSHLASCSVCSYSGNEPHRYIQVGTKYRCLDCKFISSFQSITPIGRSTNEIKFICSYDVSQTMMTYKEMIHYLTVNEYYELLVEFNMFYNAIVK